MKYQIVKQLEDYTLCEAEKDIAGEVVLLFEANTFEQAQFIKNQFLHNKPYAPFERCWIAEIRHIVSVADKVVSEQPYETRTLLVIAATEQEARDRFIKEATDYGQPYQNGNGEAVTWAFDQILSLEEADFFSTIDLYQGLPVELKSRRPVVKTD